VVQTTPFSAGGVVVVALVATAPCTYSPLPVPRLPAAFSTALPSPCLLWLILDCRTRLGRKPCLAFARTTMDLPCWGYCRGLQTPWFAASKRLGLQGEDLACPFTGRPTMAVVASLPSWRHRLAESPLRSTLMQVVWRAVMCGSPQCSFVQVQGCPWGTLSCTPICFLVIV
jgi:hypothetical protein